MRNKGKAMKVLVAVVAVVLLQACAAPLGSPSKPALTVHFSQAATGKRTILPSGSAVNLAAYRIILEGPGDTVTISGTDSSTTSVTVPSLAPGLWTVTIEGYNSTDPLSAVLFLKGEESVAIDSGSSASVNVVVTPQAVGGTGFLTLSVGWPASLTGVTEVQVLLAPVDATTNGGHTLIYSLTMSGPHSAVLDTEAVPVGMYGAVVVATGSSVGPITSNTEVVQMYSHLPTIGGVSLRGIKGMGLTGTVSVLAGKGPSAGIVDGTGPSVRLNSPYGMYLDPATRDLYFTEGLALAGGQDVRKVNLNTGIFSSIAGTRGVAGTAIDGIPGRFSGPQGILLVGTSLYVADTANDKVRAIDVATGAVSLFCTGVGTPVALATDGTDLYVADASNIKIWKVPLDTGIPSSFSTGLTTAPTGVVLDTTNSKLWVTCPDGLYGIPLGTGVAAIKSVAPPLVNPSAVAINNTTQMLYVISNGNSIVSLNASGGSDTTVAGSATAGFLDATGTFARFNNPRGLVYDSTTQSLLVSDQGNNTIRQVWISFGAVTTLAGSASATNTGGADGMGTAALFNNPVEMTSDGVFLYVADWLSHTIRKIDSVSGQVATFATVGDLNSSSGLAITGNILYVSHGTGPWTISRWNLTTGAALTDMSTGTAVYQLASDGANLYYEDGAARVSKINLSSFDADPTGSISLFVTGCDGLAFTQVQAMTSDGTNLVLIDNIDGSPNRNRICMVPLDAPTSGETVASLPTDPLLDGQSFLTDLYTDGRFLYVTQASSGGLGHSQVLVYDLLSGTGSVLSGSEGFGYSTGAALKSQFLNPKGLASNGSSLFLVDQDNQVILKIN